jgi:hypothetical protein
LGLDLLKVIGKYLSAMSKDIRILFIQFAFERTKKIKGWRDRSNAVHCPLGPWSKEFQMASWIEDLALVAALALVVVLGLQVFCLKVLLSV